MRALPALLALLLASPAWAREPVDHVDPFIGTGGHGHAYPGAALPFGMVQLSPDTRLDGWDGASGYHFSDEVVHGFSHTHLSGTGVSDYCDILLMPAVGVPPFDNGQESGPEAGYSSRFDKASESASPGFYAVTLDEGPIRVELSATERTGLHRYTYPRGEQASLILDLAHRDEVLDSSLRIVSDREIEGHRRSRSWAEDQVVHFVARFSRPVLRAELAQGDEVVPGATELEGGNLKARLAFGPLGGELLVRVGISAVDVAGARRNLDEEQGARTFEEVHEAARAAWSEALSRVEVTGGSDEQRTIFFTALYHALLAPNVFSDRDGRYRGMDRELHRAEGRRQYTVFSLWDTFRSLHPLLNLIEPERTREFLASFLAMYEQGGRLPVWELAGNETDCMIGYHSVPVIVDAWRKGLRGFDERLALEAMIDSATRDHFGLEAYRRQGFVGVEDDSESVSKTLEYAYDDWCIARFAEGLGETDTAARFDARSQAWRHLLDPGTGFLRARRNQRWLEPFDPRQVDNNYTEANAWQYRFFVPHDVEGLMAALGGEEPFVRELDALFEADSATTGRHQLDITGLIGQYAHGNEPSHHVAWLYHHAGRPWRSAERIERILSELYTAEPAGLSGNEDCGQMSAWHVLASIGLYPVTPGTDEYLIGVPSFRRTVLSLEGGRSFEIRTRGRAPGPGARIDGAWLNGRKLTRSVLHHEEIAAGGRLVLRLADTPSPTWGVAPEDRPRSRVDAPLVPAAPFVVTESEKFRDSLRVELASADPEAEILVAAPPDSALEPYGGAFTITESTRLRAVAVKDGRRSPEIESYLHRYPNDWTVPVLTEPAPQYSADGPGTLVDGLRGSTNWRIGGWLGVQGRGVTAVVDLGTTRPIRRAGADFLQDQGAWILMPPEVTISLSDDGASWREVARLETGVPPDAGEALTREVVADLAEGEGARFVRVEAKNFGPLPAWHAGAGGATWIFVDEVLIE